MLKNFARLVCLLLLASLSAHAQVIIRGTVTDKDAQPVSWATIYLLSGDSVRVNVTSSNPKGEFLFNDIRKGNYILRVTSVGSNTAYANTIITDSNVFIAPIVLTPAAGALNNVVVTAKKPQVTKYADRTVINVEGSMIATSGTVLEVLQRLPGVEVNKEANTISLNGKSEVGLLINGKYTRLPISSVIELLGSMDASSLQKVELITTPPAKYEAENTGGLINIQTSQNAENGTRGSYNMGLGYGYREKYKAALNFSTRQNRISYYGDFAINRDYGHKKYINAKTITGSNGNRSTITATDRHPVISNYTARAGMDYTYKKSNAGINFYYTRNTFVQDVSGNGTIHNGGSPPAYLDVLNKENSQRSLMVSNLNYNRKISTANLFSIDLDYLYYRNINPTQYEYTYRDQFHDPVSYSRFDAHKKTPVHVLSYKLNYLFFIHKKIKVETGFQQSISNFKNYVDVDSLDGRNFVRNSQLSGVSSLHEQISALFSTFSYGLGHQANISGGLRYEYSYGKLFADPPGQKNNRHLSGLFPSLAFSKKLGATKELQLAFGRRITRPTYSDLAPYLLFIDPSTYYNGNPALKPSISNQLSLGFLWRKVSVSLELASTKNVIFRAQPSLSDSFTQVFIPTNLRRLNTAAANINFPLTVAKIWDMNFSMLGCAQRLNIRPDYNYSNFYYTLKTTQNLKLSSQLTLQVFASYQSRRLAGFLRKTSIVQVDASIEKKMPRWNSRVQLSVNNIAGDQYTETSIPGAIHGLSTYAYNWHELRIVRLTYVHNFGKASVKTKGPHTGSTQEIEERVVR